MLANSLTTLEEGIHVSGMLESSSDVAVFQGAVCAVPGCVVVVIFGSADQGVGIGVCESVEHGVVRCADGASEVVLAFRGVAA